MTQSTQRPITTNTIEAVTVLQQGAVIAYPTEAVFGLGCDPDNQQAVSKILQIKRRPVEKGLILLASELAHLLPYIDYSALSAEQQQLLVSKQTRPTTWLVPVSAATPKWISGQFSSVAVRLTSHPLVADICQRWGKPLVSTSANYSGETPAANAEQAALLTGVDLVVDGPLGKAKQTSQIKDIFTGEVIRA
ncbi:MULTISPECIES: Sua5/YciO/YrdC/YwlC family protein [unclassified Agarivorans]|uniref:Sua5/YciO/YrdC/YwlC family protein n=1 Tax=unclassified Agarivorans TaxID=2636026 RepID=UPI0026E3346D|nr:MULTISPECIES: Sua5/YciO/YrdC/YwlC family protein [unclassified Agarivorans]MDO6685633.1 Sua5/YciO/YrdC/YwlC family protein [Agarivorans sp. 3_MG-2023]MDO6716252.1 Sua5/YciO/YrdC/YwlC family protein [Agarivorans sp. 2_MG-2023]